MRFGAGSVLEIAMACAAANIMRPLLLPDKGLAGVPITRCVLDSLAEAGLGRAIFSEVDAILTEANAAAGIKAYHDGDDQRVNMWVVAGG